MDLNHKKLREAIKAVDPNNFRSHFTGQIEDILCGSSHRSTPLPTTLEEAIVNIVSFIVELDDRVDNIGG